jgi:hypothetical protein
MSGHSLSKRFRVHGAVLNLFDKSPPLDMQTYGGGGGASFDGAFHGPGGRARLWRRRDLHLLHEIRGEVETTR